MKPVFIIALHHLRLIFKEKSTLLWMVLLPLLYILVFGNAFRSGGDASQQKSYLGVYNQDQGFLAQWLIRSIASENIQLDSLSAIPENTPTRMLVIPADFTQKLVNGEQVTLVLKKKQDTNLEAEAAASMAIRKAYFRILADLTELVVNDKELNTVNMNKLSERPPFGHRGIAVCRPACHYPFRVQSTSAGQYCHVHAHCPVHVCGIYLAAGKEYRPFAAIKSCPCGDEPNLLG
jgi:hypothetical protein